MAARIWNNSANCRLGGVVVSVLATVPKGRGFQPSRGDGIFKGVKNPQHTSFGGK
jgi:hypothetical protein